MTPVGKVDGNGENKFIKVTEERGQRHDCFYKSENRKIYKRKKRMAKKEGQTFRSVRKRENVDLGAFVSGTKITVELICVTHTHVYIEHRNTGRS